MNYEQFWLDSNPQTYWGYQVAYEKKLEEQYEFENYKAWLNGLYNFDAISKSNYNINRANKNDPVEYYLDKPIDFKAIAKQDKEDMKKKKQVALEDSMKALIKSRKSMLDKKKVG